MSYLVLARKYRPQSFEDLIGQEHVTKTLANAIAQDRVAHAFLFTGVRGVGKTTSARILAKCLNCLGPKAAEGGGVAPGPTATPCQTCAACLEIAAGVDLDVQEIDAASYNGVDEVRRLQEGLAFRPARDRFKIYIVDEVHMLSNAAWNAFLKTLEEPPPHVKFIFATTEVHKVPVTILSRCQRYDFKLVAARQIGARLRDVLGRESIAAEDGAVSILAREAAGSMRDAMSLLDQVIAYGSEKITAEDVARVLGVADREVLGKLTGAVLAGDAAAALEVLDAVARQGFDLVHVCRDLLRHVRNLVVAKVCPEEQARTLLDLADEEVADVLALARDTDADDLTRVFSGLSRTFDEIVKSGQVRASLEITLVRLARRPPLLPLDELLARLGDLEKRLATGAPPPRGGGAATGGGGGRAREPSGAAGHARSASGREPSARGARASDGDGSATDGPRPIAASFGAPSPAPTSVHVAQATGSRAHVVGLTDGSLALSEPDPTPLPPSAVAVSAPARTRSTPPPAERVALPSAPPTDDAVGGAAPVTRTEGDRSGDDAAEDVETPALRVWRALITSFRVEQPAIAAMLELAAPRVVSATEITVLFERGSFEEHRADESDAKRVVAEAARAHFATDATPQVTFEESGPGVRRGSVAEVDKKKRAAAEQKAKDDVRNHPLVQRAIEIFGAEIKEIRLPPQEE